MSLGFERRYIFSAESDRPSYGSTIYLELDGLLAGATMWMPISGEAVVYGKLSPAGRFGHLGMYKYKLEEARVLVWPWPATILLFCFLHAIPSFYLSSILLRPGVNVNGFNSLKKALPYCISKRAFPQANWFVSAGGNPGSLQIQFLACFGRRSLRRGMAGSPFCPKAVKVRVSHSNI